MNRRNVNISRNELTGSALFREIAAIRTDSLWRMLTLGDRIPAPEEEGASGTYDNKGAIFIPGGFVYYNSERKPVVPQYDAGTRPMSEKRFRKNVRTAMRQDNASLVYPNGLAYGVNLDNSFYLSMGVDILRVRIDARMNTRRLGSRRLDTINAASIARSYFPYRKGRSYLFGSRTLLTSAIGVCLANPSLFRDLSKLQLGLNNRQVAQLTDELAVAMAPVYGANDRLLAPPYMFVCHDTRYDRRSLVGLTRIIGGLKFGEFATFSLEEASRQADGTFDDDHYFAVSGDRRFVGVLRLFGPAQNAGQRPAALQKLYLKPRADLDLDIAAIAAHAEERYGAG